MLTLESKHRWPTLGLLLFSILFVLVMHRGWAWDGVGGGFHPGHVWAADQVSAMVAGRESWSGATSRIGFPEPVQLRLIGWAPLLLAVPLGWLLGSPLAIWVVIVAGLFATTLVTKALIERMYEVAPWTAAMAALTYAVCPFSLGVLANGQLAKMQLWCLPLLLLFADKVLRDSNKKMATVGLLASSVVMAFTSPSIGLVMPIALAVWVLFRTPGMVAWRWSLIVLVVAATGMLPAWWMHTVPSSLTVGLLPAAPVPGLQSPPHLSPVATLSGLLGNHVRWDGMRTAINNVAVLGIPALLGGVLACLVRTQTAFLGVALCVAGVALAVGPTVNALGFVWVMPAELLDRFGYPLQESGMYYRFVQVASLGLALCCVAPALLWPRQGRWIVLALALVICADGVRTTSSLWPRTIRTIGHKNIYTAMANDSVDGAVLELPLSHIDTEGERRLLGQLIHGRSTSVLARNMVVQGQPRLEALDRAVRSANPRQQLHQLGFRYVLLHQPRAHMVLYRQLSRTLGQPNEDGGLAAWVVHLQ